MTNNGADKESETLRDLYNGLSNSNKSDLARGRKPQEPTAAIRDYFGELERLNPLRWRIVVCLSAARKSVNRGRD